MIKFKEFIAEDRNLHMTHLTDAVINGGVKGTRQAINYLRALRDMLGGDTQAAINVSVKWDGAPSVFAGIDPTDGKFFIAKKSIFNKNPKVYKTTADIDADTSGDLNAKLKLGLAEFSKLGIKGVIQGDFLFSSDDVKTEIIDGEEYVTFHPNTISYAVPADSELAKTILASKLGVVWHTVYSGDSFENMKASFGEDIVNKLTTTKSVWGDISYYRRFVVGIDRSKMKLYNLEDGAQKNIQSESNSSEKPTFDESSFGQSFAKKGKKKFEMEDIQ